MPLIAIICRNAWIIGEFSMGEPMPDDAASVEGVALVAGGCPICKPPPCCMFVPGCGASWEFQSCPHVEGSTFRCIPKTLLRKSPPCCCGCGRLCCCMPCKPPIRGELKLLLSIYPSPPNILASRLGSSEVGAPLFLPNRPPSCSRNPLLRRFDGFWIWLMPWL